MRGSRRRGESEGTRFSPSGILSEAKHIKAPGASRGAKVYVPPEFANNTGLDGLDYDNLVVGYKGQYFVTRFAEEDVANYARTGTGRRLIGASYDRRKLSRINNNTQQLQGTGFNIPVLPATGRRATYKVYRQSHPLNEFTGIEEFVNTASRLPRGALSAENFHQRGRVLSQFEVYSAIQKIDAKAAMARRVATLKGLRQGIKNLFSPITESANALVNTGHATIRTGASVIKGVGNIGGTLRGKAVTGFQQSIVNRISQAALSVADRVLDQYSGPTLSYGQNVAEFGIMGYSSRTIYNELPFMGGAVGNATDPYQLAAEATAAELRSTSAFRQPGYLQNNAMSASWVWDRQLWNAKLQANETQRVFRFANKRMEDDRYEAAAIMRRSFGSVLYGLIDLLWRVISSVAEFVFKLFTGFSKDTVSSYHVKPPTGLGARSAR